MRKRFLAILSVLAMLAGFAHAGLHLAGAPQDHFAGSSLRIDCPLASIDKWSPVPPLAAAPLRIALPAVLPPPDSPVIARPALPWRSRAPPPAAV